ncbi:hypothetical protein PMAYCL1PPCAC_10876, partial [Pristionchus mayeri]
QDVHHDPYCVVKTMDDWDVCGLDEEEEWEVLDEPHHENQSIPYSRFCNFVELLLAVCIQNVLECGNELAVYFTVAAIGALRLYAPILWNSGPGFWELVAALLTCFVAWLTSDRIRYPKNRHFDEPRHLRVRMVTISVTIALMYFTILRSWFEEWLTAIPPPRGYFLIIMLFLTVHSIDNLRIAKSIRKVLTLTVQGCTCAVVVGLTINKERVGSAIEMGPAIIVMTEAVSFCFDKLKDKAQIWQEPLHRLWRAWMPRDPKEVIREERQARQREWRRLLRIQRRRKRRIERYFWRRAVPGA